MRKIASIVALALGLLFCGAPATAESDHQPHIDKSAIPPCYDFNATAWCTTPINCDHSDRLCDWFCIDSNVPVECVYSDYDDPGKLAWLDVLEYAIDSYQGQVARLDAVAEQRRERLERKTERINRLRHRVDQQARQIRHLRATVRALKSQD